MANAPQQRDIKWDKKLVEQFNQRFVEVMSWGEKAGVPLPVMEGLMRDWLAQVDALRMARQLASQWDALGLPAFKLPH